MSLPRERSRSPCGRESDDDEHWLSDIFEGDECADTPAIAIDTEAHLTSGPIASATEPVIVDVAAPVEFVAVPTTPRIVGVVEARLWPRIPELVDHEYHDWGFLSSEEQHRNQDIGQFPILRARLGTVLMLAIGGKEYRMVAGSNSWEEFGSG
jgi:hypothetical protein